MKTIDDLIANLSAGLVVFVVLAVLVVATFNSIDSEMANRETHNRIHRHDLAERGR